MSKWISMLRGINVSGKNMMRMGDLKRLYEGLGFAEVETYVQSGNVVFESVEQDPEKLAVLIEAQIEKTFGYKVSVFMRDAGDLQRIIEGSPFSGRERNEDPARLYVTFLYQAPAGSELSGLAKPVGENDEFAVGEQEIYLFCPNGYGRSKLSNTFFERKLKQPATTRNWATVNALYKMAKDS